MGEKSEDKAQPPQQRLPVAKLALGVVLLGACGATAIVLLKSGPTPVESKNLLDETELCQSCHPLAKHKPVVGHTDLARIGCTPCHGGDGAQLDKELAHGPRLGEGRDPFLPKGQYLVGCTRCHIPGQVKGMEKIVAGHTSYLHGTCVGCHGPGHQPPEIGPSLNTVPPKHVAYLKRWLLDSRSVLATASMWSIRDGTYQDHFADTDEGRQNIERLITYVLSLNDRPQRRTYAEYVHRPKLRIDAPCTSCHILGDATTKAKGKGHRCTMLRNNNDLRCVRCHQSAAVKPAGNKGMCPQIAAAVHLCGTCHLRDDDGGSELVKRALRMLP
ncbi:MAG: hypothetical protein JRH20_00305 [Deltaproteobacteria bacterium]|nr:hypothetical protein [Deltaproteobacteria bacterium]